MAEAYDGAGGRASLRALGPFGTDGHRLAGDSDGVSVWSGSVADFLAGLR